MAKNIIPFETLVSDLHGPDWQKCCDAARLLGQSRDPRAVEVLLPDLHDPDWRVRRNAVQALGALRLPQCVKPLLEALGDRTNTVRQRALVGLGRIKDPQAIPALLDALLHGTSSYVIDAAFHALKKFGRKAGPSVAETLKAHPRPDLIDLLVEIKATDQTELLINLADQGQPPFRVRALSALGRIGDQRAIDYLINHLTNDDLQIQAAVIRALGQLGAVQVLPQLLDLLQGDELHGPHADVNHAVCEAFQLIAGIAGELEAAFPGKFPTFYTFGVSASLPEALSGLGNEQFQKLNKLLADMEDRVEWTGKSLQLPPETVQKLSDQTWKFGAMLQDSRDARAERIKLLIGLLKSDGPHRRAAAALTLPWYSDASALPPLEAAASESDPLVQKAAKWAHAALKKYLSDRNLSDGHLPYEI